MTTTAGVIVIGNEVLSGKVEEQNARFLIRELRGLGVRLERVVVIRDDVATIGAEVAKMALDYDYVFTSGGVGSTHDDVTFEGVAQGLGRRLIVQAELLQLLESHFSERMNDSVRRMCTVPEGTTLLWGEPGRYPVVTVDNVFVLPGVPEFLRAKFEILKGRLSGSPFWLRQLYVRPGEDEIAELLGEIQGEFSDLELGSYPRFDTDEYRVRVTVEGRDRARVEAAFEALMGRLPAEAIVRTE